MIPEDKKTPGVNRGDQDGLETQNKSITEFPGSPALSMDFYAYVDALQTLVDDMDEVAARLSTAGYNHIASDLREVTSRFILEKGHDIHDLFTRLRGGRP